jgi:hypothetical protein
MPKKVVSLDQLEENAREVLAMDMHKKCSKECDAVRTAQYIVSLADNMRGEQAMLESIIGDDLT